MADARQQITLEEAGAELGEVARAQRDTAGLIRGCSVAIMADSRKNFEAGADPEGRPWRPLAHPRPGGRGGLPLRNYGLLMASVVGKGSGHVEQLGATTLVMGTNRPGAMLHQEGGTVTPKGHPFLAIPATREAERAGSPRRFPLPLSPRIGKRGGVLVQRYKKGAKSNVRTRRTTGVIDKVQFYLTRSVTVPARPYLGFGRRLLDALQEIAQDWLARKFRK